MARLISKARTLYAKPFPFPSSVRVAVRHRSSQPSEPQMIQVDLGGEHDMAMKLFDDLIHRILVKKATPDWLPFVPGSSFWVPPRPSPSNVADLVHKLTVDDLISEEESLAVATLRGWPSSNFYIKEENASTHDGNTDVEVNVPEGMEGTVIVKVVTFPENVAHSEDEEG